jgi:hypothetical protein
MIPPRSGGVPETANVSLPGTFDLPMMERVTADLGKCPVCGVARVKWIDEENGVMLCGRLYGERRQETRIITAESISRQNKHYLS